MLILKIIPPQGVPLTPPPQRAVQLACNRAAAEAALPLLQQHFQAQGGQNFWRGAAAATAIESLTPAAALIGIRQRGVRLQWQGGTIKPTGKPSEVTGKPTKALLIPVGNSPLKHGKRLKDLSIPQHNIHPIKTKNGKVYLIARQGKRSTLLGALVPRAVIPAHPAVLPTRAELQQTIRPAAARALREQILTPTN